MSTAGLISAIGAGILGTVSAIYLGRAKGAEHSRRRSILFTIAGTMLLVGGFSLMIAVKVIPELEKAGTLLIGIGITFLLVGAICLEFRRVYKIIRVLQEKSTDQSPSDKV